MSMPEVAPYSAASYALQAANAVTVGEAVLKATLRDFDTLKKLSGAESWDDSSPVAIIKTAIPNTGQRHRGQ